MNKPSSGTRTQYQRRPNASPARPSGPGGRGGGSRGQSRGRSSRPAAHGPVGGAARNSEAGTVAARVEPSTQAAAETVATVSREIELPTQITVRELSTVMGCGPIELIKQLMNAGIMANINQLLDYDTAAIVAEDMGYHTKPIEVKAPEPEVKEIPAHTVRRREYSEEEQRFLKERPPVVTILGHVDHGKTSLLDAIRVTNVQAHEAGGITQHIGAYQIQVKDKQITFLDTPGHEAFTAMRARGASVTDIAVLVVAADDGVQPQTLEAINHARAAQVTIIVALNKMDLATANPDRVKQQLADAGLVVEDWGGDTICVPVSARTKMGIDGLLDMILLVSEMAELKANPRGKVQGAVIESRLDRSRGPTATILVQDGTLKVGDVVLVGKTLGKIRAMFDHQGQALKRALPATPAVVIGLQKVPEPGDSVEVFETEKEARDLAEQHIQASQAKEAHPAEPLSLEEIYARAQAGAVQGLNLILKVDVQGSIEPIKNSLEKIEMGELAVKFIHQGVGTIVESDVMLAAASQAVIIGFNVNVEPSAQRMVETEHVSIRTYSVIYRLIEDVQLALKGMLAPVYQQVVQGQAVVREVFSISRIGKVAGVQVTDGKALRNAQVRIMREGLVLFEGHVGSLKRFTEDVRAVSTGMECGVMVDGFDRYQPGDTLEFYLQEVVKQ